jgi:hypothetical protein
MNKRHAFTHVDTVRISARLMATPARVLHLANLQMKPMEVANWAHALCVLEAEPNSAWAVCYIQAAQALLGVMAPLELATTIRGVPGIFQAASRHDAVSRDSSSSSSSSSSCTNSYSSSCRTSDSSSVPSVAEDPHGLASWQRACSAALTRALPALDIAHVSAVLWGMSQLGWQPEAPLLAALLSAVLGGGDKPACQGEPAWGGPLQGTVHGVGCRGGFEREAG